MDADFMTAVSKFYGDGYEFACPLRDFIGSVCLLKKGDESFVLKLSRLEQPHIAIRAVALCARLTDFGVRAPRVIPAMDGGETFEYRGRTGYITEFIDGIEPDRDVRLEDIGEISLKMTEATRDYTQLISHAKEFFVDRYIPIIRRLAGRLTPRFAEIGAYLYDKVTRLPATFCHGDFHAGNMLEAPNGDIFLLDFDAAALASRAYDAATACDCTNYFDASPDKLEIGYGATMKLLEIFARVARLNADEMASVPYWLAIRHYDIQATIIDSLGDDCVDRGFIENQLKWLENWLALIARGSV